MAVFSKAFFLTAVENAITAGAAAFAGSLFITTTPSLKGFIASAIGAGVAALATFLKAYGGNQALKQAAAVNAAKPPTRL